MICFYQITYYPNQTTYMKQPLLPYLKAGLLAGLVAALLMFAVFYFQAAGLITDTILCLIMNQ
jgi:hypothetical protein